MNDVTSVGSESTYWLPPPGGAQMAFVFAEYAGMTWGRSGYVDPTVDHG
jgi:hypothetical protein